MYLSLHIPGIFQNLAHILGLPYKKRLIISLNEFIYDEKNIYTDVYDGHHFVINGTTTAS